MFRYIGTRIDDWNTSLSQNRDKNNSLLSDVYQKILQLTYGSDPMMMKDLENYCQGFDSGTLIGINRFGRIDATLQIMRHRYPTPDEYDRLSDRYLKNIKSQSKHTRSVDHNYYDYVNSDLNTMIGSIDSVDLPENKKKQIKAKIQNICNKIQNRINETIRQNIESEDKLSEYSKEFYRLFWTIDLSDSIEKIIEDMWFGSLMIPINSWIFEVLLSQAEIIPNKNIRYALGEYDKTEIEFLVDDFEYLSDAIHDEYASHSLLFVFDDTEIYVYDPDDQNVFLPGSRILSRTYIESKVDPPIQSITDDIYCIFHSIFAMIDMSEILNTEDDKSDKADKFTLRELIDSFETYQNQLNKSSRIQSIVRYRITDVLERYPLSKK